MRGSLDLCECDLNTDLYKVISKGASENEELFCNVFENKEGQAFYAHTRASQPSLIELRKISGEPIALLDTQESAKLRSVSTFFNTVVGVTDQKFLAVFTEAGTCDWKPQSTADGVIQQMMQEEIDEDESDLNTGSKGMNNKFKPKKF